jgi:hypothetical protein
MRFIKTFLALTLTTQLKVQPCAALIPTNSPELPHPKYRNTGLPTRQYPTLVLIDISYTPYFLT